MNWGRSTGVALALTLGVAGGAMAQQVTENCTVSVLNRTVTANADGTWVLPNVPANFGPVRARVTCAVNGQTISGESEPFVIPANGVVNIPKITFGQTTPIPTALTVVAPGTPLTQSGATSQLVATARYSDGSTKDVTADGTTYTVSNAGIASVTGGGLVQAVSSGTVIVQASHEGASGMTTVQVALTSADTDGDGIPDAVELSLGLNPNNPVDAQEDFDRDGLTNLQEYQLGTDLRNADTDGDGLKDGDEVTRGTSPLLKDTDGDGVNDGLEVQTGSDPRNPGSINLSGALNFIAVMPANFALTFNTIAGDVSVQLKVTGTLKDGTTLDVTQRGVNYSSTNLTVCNFGAGAGRVYAGVSGTCIVTATLGTVSATAAGSVTTFAPTPLSSVPLGGPGNGVDVAGDYVYVAAGAAGLKVVDVVNRSAPRVAATLSLLGSANDVKLAGTLAFVAGGGAGMHVVDISNPLLPRLLGSVDTPGDATDVRTRGNLALIADGTAGLQVIDIATPNAPRIVGSVATGPAAVGVDIDGTIAVVATGSMGLRVVDVSNPTSPVVVGSLATPGGALDVVAKDGLAYVADWTGSMRAVDFRNPAAPVLRGVTTTTLGGILLDVALMDSFVFGADMFFVNGVPIVDVSDPSSLRPRAILNFPGDATGLGIAADGSYLYLGTDTGQLYIGQYRVRQDTNGIPPTVNIASPTDGATFVEGETVVVTVNATDDLAVAAVTLQVNGVTVATDTTAPYQFNVTAPIGAATLRLGAQAGDLGNNTGTATDVVLGIIPDPLTTVVGRIVVGQYAAPVGLIGYWPLDGDGVDASGAGRDLSLEGGVGFGAGVVAQALDLRNNVARFAVRQMDDAAYDFGSGDFTIQTWVNFNDTSRTQTVLEKFASTSGPGWTLNLLGGNAWHFYALPSIALTSPAQTIPVGTWHHLLVRRRGPLFEMFYDGTVVASGSTNTSVPDTAFPLLLGKRNDADGRGFAMDGRVDEVAIWGRALSDGDIAALIADPGLLSRPPVAAVPIAGAQVSCSTRNGLTAADGSFAISDVPTTQPQVACTAILLPSGGTTLFGTSRPVSPVRTGNTSVGDISLWPVPVVATITPKVIDAQSPPTSLQVTGSNLGGATFSFAPSLIPPLLTAGVPTVNATGTAVSLPIAVSATTRGRFTLVATNAFGVADTSPTPGNTLVVINAQDDADTDGDGFADGLETLYASDPGLAGSTPLFSDRGIVLSSALTVTNRLLSLAVPRNQDSEADRDGDGFPEGLELLYGSNPFDVASVPALTTRGTLLSGALSVTNKLLSLAVQRNQDSEADRDGDGFPEGLELLYGSNPFDVASVPALTTRGTLLSGALSVTNKLLSLAVQRNQDSEADRDGDGFPEGLELLYGSNPFDVASVPRLTDRGTTLSSTFSVVNRQLTLPTQRHSQSVPVSVVNTAIRGTNAIQQDVLSLPVSIANTLLPPASVQTAVSPSVAVSNSATAPVPHELLGPAVSVLNAGSTTAPASAERAASVAVPPLQVRLAGPADGQRVVEGQTVTVRADLVGVAARVEFLVNGVTLAADSALPYELPFTIPSGVGTLTFGATAVGPDGARASASPINVAVGADSTSTVVGRVVDSTGAPISGAIAELRLDGLRAELFAFASPLNSMPNLTGLTPNRVTWVTAVNVRNPNGLFGVDPLGARLGPNYAMRLTGWFAAEAGLHTFFLAGDDGALLRVNRQDVASIPGGVGRQESAGTLALSAGLTPIEIVTYRSSGNGELQLSFTRPGGVREVVLPSFFAASGSAFTAITDASGNFSIHGVPSGATVQVTAIAADGARTFRGASPRLLPVLTDSVDVGDIVVPRPGENKPRGERERQK